MQGIDVVFSILILIMSVVVHEVSHGYMAYALGDATAKYAGRLTLNPLKHLDPVGSVIVPLLSYMLGGFVFGWAKPVPYNPYNLRNQRWGEVWVAIAGPLSNVIIALVFGLLLRVGIAQGVVSQSLASITGLVVIINLVLALVNMIPVPPLDGSKLLFALLPYRYVRFRQAFEQYFLFVALLAVFVLSPVITHVLGFLFTLLTGQIL